MHAHSDVRERDWIEALRGGSTHLPGPADRAHLFHERRTDLRVEVGPTGVREAVATQLHGLSAHASPEGDRSVFLSDPEPSDATAAALSLAQGTPLPGHGSRGAPSEGWNPSLPYWLNPDAVVPLLIALREEVLSTLGGSAGAAVAKWIAFRQDVVVARRDRIPAADVRAGCRIRLEARCRGRKEGSAIGDLALRLEPSRPFPSRQASELARAVAERALIRREAVAPPRGEVAVVFAPGTGGVLIHEIVGHALEADAVLAGESALASAEGPVAPTAVSIVDDPRRGRAPWRIDDEGEEARATALVRAGRVAGYLTDLRHAACVLRPPTGHGRRSGFHEIVKPRMGCTFLVPGSSSPSDALDATRNGVYVRRMDLASANPGLAAAVFRISDADLVIGGRIAAPLDPFVLRVDTVTALRGLGPIADDLEFDRCVGSCIRDGQPLAMSVGAPTFRIGLARVVS